MRLLPLEDAPRHLDEGARAVERELVAPRGWDVREVRLGERRGGGARPLTRQCVQADPARDVGKQMSGISNRIAPGDRIEVDEHRAIARQEDVIGLQVPMDRPWRGLPQDRKSTRLNSS